MELETFQALLKDKTTRTIKGEDLFQDIELDHWKVKADIARVKRDLTDLGRHCFPIQQHLGSMERGVSSFWPKLMLHPSCPINFDLDPNFVIMLKPCGFCRVWYNF